MIKIDKPIILSILDTDLYKVTMGQMVFHDFPEAVVQYDFINRGKTPFPPGFDKALQEQINHLASLRLTPDEEGWTKTIPYIRPTYIEWLRGYIYDPNKVVFELDSNGQLRLQIHGPWYRTIYWEVPLMAIISELFFKMTNQQMDSNAYSRIITTAENLRNADAYWIDFGTRRRFSYEIQNAVVRTMKKYKGFLGTSNPYLAYIHGVTPHGTFAHELVQGISGMYGVRGANTITMKRWAEHFNGNLGVALSDTFGTFSFLRDFDIYTAKLFDGVRQDSGDPIFWGHKIIEHYKKLGIPTSNKRLVFSDNLNDEKYIKIHNLFKDIAQPIGGIGTFLSNNVGVKPLNMVVKLKRIKKTKNSEWIDVVKLSDDPGKEIGTPEAIELAKKELGISA
jgi:nicotinate phosphoribosyltransferase